MPRGGLALVVISVFFALSQRCKSIKFQETKREQKAYKLDQIEQNANTEITFFRELTVLTNLFTGIICFPRSVGLRRTIALLLDFHSLEVHEKSETCTSFREHLRQKCSAHFSLVQYLTTKSEWQHATLVWLT